MAFWSCILHIPKGFGGPGFAVIDDFGLVDYASEDSCLCLGSSYLGLIWVHRQAYTSFEQGQESRENSF